MKKIIFTLSLCCVALVASITKAGTITDDFNDGTLDPGWTQTTGTWTESGGVLTVAVIAGDALISHSAVPTDSPFSISMDFDFTIAGSGWAGAAWNVGGIGGNGDESYVFRVRQNNGRVTMTFADPDGSVGQAAIWKSNDVGSGGDIGAVTLNNTYRITVGSTIAGSFSAQLIDVDGGHSGSSVLNVLASTGVQTHSTLTGGNLGIYAREDAVDVLQVDSFTATSAPEPSSLLLLGIASLGLLGVRRRKS